MIRELSQTTIEEYASDIGATKEQPIGEDYTLGAKVGKTIPAKWWNWLFSATTKRVMQGRNDTQDIFTEVKNVLVDANIEPNPADNTQLAQAVKVKAVNTLEKYIQSKGAVGADWDGSDEIFDVPIGVVYDKIPVNAPGYSNFRHILGNGKSVMALANITGTSNYVFLYTMNGIIWTPVTDGPTLSSGDILNNPRDVRVINSNYFYTVSNFSTLMSNDNGNSLKRLTFEYGGKVRDIGRDVAVIWTGEKYIAMQKVSTSAVDTVQCLVESVNGYDFSVVRTFPYYDSAKAADVYELRAVYNGNYLFVMKGRYDGQATPYYLATTSDFETFHTIEGIEPYMTNVSSYIDAFTTYTSPLGVIISGDYTTKSNNFIKCTTNGVNFTNIVLPEITGSVSLRNIILVDNDVAIEVSTSISGETVKRSFKSSDLSNWMKSSYTADAPIYHVGGIYARNGQVSYDLVKWSVSATGVTTIPLNDTLIGIKETYAYISMAAQVKIDYMLNNSCGVYFSEAVNGSRSVYFLTASTSMLYDTIIVNTPEELRAYYVLYSDNNYVFFTTNINNNIMVIDLGNSNVSTVTTSGSECGFVNGVYFVITSQGILYTENPSGAWLSIDSITNCIYFGYFNNTWVCVTKDSIKTSNNLTDWTSIISVSDLGIQDATVRFDSATISEKLVISTYVNPRDYHLLPYYLMCYTDDLQTINKAATLSIYNVTSIRLYTVNNTFLMCTNSKIFYSYEGIEWFEANCPDYLSVDPNVKSVKDLLFNRNYILINGNAIYTSTNLVDWTKSQAFGDNISIQSIMRSAATLKVSGVFVNNLRYSPMPNSVYMSTPAGVNAVVRHKLYLR